MMRWVKSYLAPKALRAGKASDSIITTMTKRYLKAILTWQTVSILKILIIHPWAPGKEELERRIKYPHLPALDSRYPVGMTLGTGGRAVLHKLIVVCGSDMACVATLRAMLKLNAAPQCSVLFTGRAHCMKGTRGATHLLIWTIRLDCRENSLFVMTSTNTPHTTMTNLNGKWNFLARKLTDRVKWCKVQDLASSRKSLRESEGTVKSLWKRSSRKSRTQQGYSMKNL